MAYAKYNEETNFSFYASDSRIVGMIIGLMAKESDGEVGVKINSDDEGNVVFSVTGYTKDLDLVRKIYEQLIRDNIQVEAVF